MPVAKKVLKDIPCKFNEGDIFTDGTINYTVVTKRTRDEYKAILKEPMYVMEKFPNEIYRNDKLFLTLNNVEMTESQIQKLIGLTWKKVD